MAGRATAILLTALIALSAGALFFAAAQAKGGYVLTDSILGATWTAIITLLITMPLLITTLRRRGATSSR
jgi:hypothetical protein